jgi:ASC-1-like (ASCH) protein
MKILHLTLMKKWFDLIKSGEKKVEYREIKPYWTKRLFDKEGKPIKYDFILFRNGYSKDSPKMMVEFLGIKTTSQYEVLLGEIIKK